MCLHKCSRKITLISNVKISTENIFLIKINDTQIMRIEGEEMYKMESRNIGLCSVHETCFIYVPGENLGSRHANTLNE